MEKQKKINLALLCLIVINILLSIGLACFQKSSMHQKFFGKTMQSEDKYLLYIGINDKDTNLPKYTQEEAKEIVNKICTKYVGGYTVLNSDGGWIDEKGVLFREKILVYELNDASEEQIKSILDEAIVALNQSSILVEKQNVSYIFYSK